MNSPLRIVFAGTPDFAARHLAELLSQQHQAEGAQPLYQIVAAYTQPDRPAGRGKKLTPSPVKTLAQEHNLPVFQPENFKSESEQQILAELKADLMIVVAYGLLLPEVILNTPRLGCINVHGSLLPRWRGAAPIQRAIWAGDTETGVTIMQMDIGLDTGDMLSLARLPIEKTDTSASVYEKLAHLGPQALIACLKDIQAGNAQPIKQNDKDANYAKKLSKEEAKIDWHDEAEQIERCVRAFNPWPVSFFTMNTHNIKVWQSRVEPSNRPLTPGQILQTDKTGIYVATGKNILVLEKIQIPGKKALPVQDVLNATHHGFQVGHLLVE